MREWKRNRGVKGKKKTLMLLGCEGCEGEETIDFGILKKGKGREDTGNGTE